jgi:predicted nucleic acid-binding protein
MTESLTRTLGLHAGEAEALQVALENRDGFLVTDDAAARLAAASLGLRVRGTIGLLVRAIRRELKSTDEVLELLRAIPEKSSLHVSRSLLEEVIARVQREGQR